MSLRVWQLAAFAYVLVLMLVALEVPLALNLSKRVDAEVKAQAANQAQLVAASAAGRLDDRSQLTNIARTSAQNVGGRVIIVDTAGRLLADSAGSGLSAVSYASRPEIRAALAGTGVSQGTRHSDSLEEDLLFTAVPIVQGAARTGAVRVTQSVDAVRAEVRRDTIALVGLGVAALALGLVVAWMLAGFLSRPLRGLTKTARRVEAGDLDARAQEAGAREHREVAHAFNDMTERLSQSMAAQRDFVANAAHQLRTPLTGLRLRLEAAGLKTDDEALRRDLEAGEREAERLARTVTDLLTLAREGQRPAAVAPLSLTAAGEAAIERWVSVADEHDCELALRDRSAGAHVQASSEDVAVILDNLIENAIEHTAPHTTVAVELGVAGDDGRIAVDDAGPGLRPGEEERVFERFFRGSSRPDRPRGSGLGLTIVRVLARRWGGDARIANRAEGGARAEVRLPLATALPPDGPTASDRALTTTVMEER
jgi:two-component system, OmpR family, sensor kinase